MPDEQKPPIATTTVVNNGLGWLSPIANFTIAGGMMAFVFWYSMTMNTRMDHMQDDANNFHRDIYQEMGSVRAREVARDSLLLDVQHRLNEADKKLDRIEFRLAFQSGGLSALFTTPKEKDK